MGWSPSLKTSIVSSGRSWRFLNSGCHKRHPQLPSTRMKTAAMVENSLTHRHGSLRTHQRRPTTTQAPRCKSCRTRALCVLGAEITTDMYSGVAMSARRLRGTCEDGFSSKLRRVGTGKVPAVLRHGAYVVV